MRFFADDFMIKNDRKKQPKCTVNLHENRLCYFYQTNFVKDISDILYCKFLYLPFLLLLFRYGNVIMYDNIVSVNKDKKYAEYIEGR